MTTAVAKTDAGLPAQIRKMEQAFQLAMPRGTEAKQLIRDALTCLQTNPKLAECEQKSLLGALMTCAQLGLRPGVGALGHAYLLPFWDGKTRGQKAQLVIGYQGYVELAHRSGRIASIHARTVYSNDEFYIEYGASEDKWVHRPCIDGSRGEPRLFYAVGRTIEGGYSITDPMTVADMEAYRDKHATARNREGKIFGPWVDHFEAMAHKTMVRKLMKLLPKSTEIVRAMAQDDGIRVDLGASAIDDKPDYIDGEAEETTPNDEAPANEPMPESPEVLMATEAQVRKVNILLQECGISTGKDGRAAGLAWLSAEVQTELTSSKELTREQASMVIQVLEHEKTQRAAAAQDGAAQ
ncbi:recombination protein RecT [Mycobacteroides abscessus]|uniref:recombination protein RecT n=1 Tax=Mycobacteroides abscessus TaxID=36809 RepID=UPI0005E9AF15|nr:recombination protein RecT [Mycobacteroides abscessus]CPR79508.1 recombination and repair protein RecT [Mycobacteroides abscessus]CPR88622.1 recombination and repair protein RecT [Mycobacteroides abscessus]CPS43559.1 recombination and repair protein RecT [Mycobacteroides abscessus]CPV03349.1 recombination and repair protein RecT [Mycobacteroides abscessus]